MASAAISRVGTMRRFWNWWHRKKERETKPDPVRCFWKPLPSAQRTAAAWTMFSVLLEWASNKKEHDEYHGFFKADEKVYKKGYGHRL